MSNSKPQLHAVDGGRTQFYSKPTVEQIMQQFGATREQAEAMHKDVSMTGAPAAPIKMQGGDVKTRVYIAMNDPIAIGRYNTDGEFSPIIAIPRNHAFVIPAPVQRLAVSIRGGEGLTAYVGQKDLSVLSSNAMIEAGVLDVMSDFVRALIGTLHQHTHTAHDGVLQAGKLVTTAVKDDRVAEFDALKVIKVQIAELLREHKDLTKLLKADERNETNYFRALGQFHHFGLEQSLQQSLMSGLVALCCLSRVDDSIRQKLIAALLDFYYSSARRVYSGDSQKSAHLKASLDAFVRLNAHLLKMQEAR